MVDRDFQTFTFQQLIEDGVLEIGDGYRARNEELGGNGPIFLRAGHITDAYIDFDGVERFHSALADKVRAKTAQPGDTIITTKGNSTGRTSFVTARMPPFVYSPHLSYWRSRDQKQLANGFLRYWSRSFEFVRQLSGMKASTDMAPYLSLTDQRRLKITVPPIRHQQAIACVLGSLDDKIELNRRMNQTLEAMAQAIFKSWFVDFEPVRAKAAGKQPPGLAPQLAALFPEAFENSELGEIPQGWKTRRLYDTAQYINGAAFRNEHFCHSSDGLPVIKIAELKNGITSQTKFSNRVDLDSKYHIDTGEMLYSWSGSPDTSLDTFLWTKGRGLLNQHIFRVLTAGAAQKHFVYYLLKHLRQTLIEIARNKQTTGLGHITAADMQRLMVCWPPDNVLGGFELQIGPIFEKCFVTTLVSQSLTALRDALLPKLISGELRVPDAERIIGRAL